jgi:uncharacterized membrane protein
MPQEASKETAMKTAGNLWAITYDAPDRAEQVRAELQALEERQFLLVEDMAVAVRDRDGTFRLDHAPFPVVGNILGFSAVGFLAGLVLLAPLPGAAVGALIGAAGSAIAARIGIDEEFIREVTGLMKPGTSALFLLDVGADMDVLLYRIRGLGGTILKTNVDAEYARQIQATLAAPSPEAPTSEARG